MSTDPTTPSFAEQWRAWHAAQEEMRASAHGFLRRLAAGCGPMQALRGSLSELESSSACWRMSDGGRTTLRLQVWAAGAD